MIATLSTLTPFNSYQEVRCYTLKADKRLKSEFLDFTARMMGKLTDRIELQELLRQIKNVADDWGISESIINGSLKKEENAHRFVLPIDAWTTRNSAFGLRLYCVIVGPKTLILLNGDLKTTQEVEKCENCKEHFYFANAVAEAIERDLNDGTIGIDEDGFIEADDDYKLIISD